MPIRMPSVSFVVARSEPGHIIGCDNQLPWKLRTDLQNFKRITSNHTVIMGRKTFDSIGRPLPNRINIVLSSKQLSSPNSRNLFFAQSKISALYMADFFSTLHGYDEIFVIGGGTIYKEFPYNKIHLTEVYAPHLEGDTFFDEKFDRRLWKLESMSEFPASEFDEYSFAIKVLKKRDKTIHRTRKWSLARFFTPDRNLEEWEVQQLKKLKLPKFRRPTLRAIQLEFPEVSDELIVHA